MFVLFWRSLEIEGSTLFCVGIIGKPDLNGGLKKMGKIK